MFSKTSSAVVRPAAVGFGHGANGLDGGREEVRREVSGAPRRSNSLRCLFAMREHGAQIGFEHPGDVRRRVQQALHHVLGDAFADGGVGNQAT